MIRFVDLKSEGGLGLKKKKKEDASATLLMKQD